MSLEAILDAIEAAGEAQVTQLRREAEGRAQAILAEAAQEAVAHREIAWQVALHPAAGERAQRLHQARLEALHLVASACDDLVATALAGTRQQLACLRETPAYAQVLRRLTEEALQALGKSELQESEAQPCLGADPRDETIMSGILRHLALELPVHFSLNGWGGVVIRSGDGRIVVTNTLESRLERALPYLRPALAAFFSDQLSVTSDQSMSSD
jgi:V/A-type H+-transporting ATPase subunit E